MCGAINASVTEKACVCQLLNMRRGHSERRAGGRGGGEGSCRINHSPLKCCVGVRLPSLSLWWGVNGGEFSWWVGPDTGDVTPPPIRLAAEAAENRRRTLPTGFFACLNLLHPHSFLSRWRQNGAVQHRPGEHKEFYHKPGSSVCRI